MTIQLTLIAVILLAASGGPGLWFDRRAAAGQWIATALMFMGGALGAIASASVLVSGQADGIDMAWFLPWGKFTLQIDAISSVFLLPVFIVPTLGSVYGMGYWRQAEHPDNGRKLRLFYGFLAASMAMVVLAQDGIVFMLAWEIMAIAAFFLITTDDGDSAARQAGWVYLVAAHLGTLCLLPMFGLLAHASGSFAIRPFGPGEIAPNISTAAFVLALLGFGLKAGIVPLHVWLPGAHANAPSHVSAVLSGVMLKMGVYGLVRVLSVLPVIPTWWGGTLLVIGAGTGLLGIVYAIGQHDLKRLLAYSSIENIGIIMIGVGLAALGRTLNQPMWIALGLGGALLHAWNHSLFKPLLFFGAGSVIHGAQTREIDRLGGMARHMPHTAALFAVGAVAICGLPPLNGFVSEFLLYLGLFGTLGLGGESQWPWAAFVPPVLAMTGCLALVCFVKAYAAVFLGLPRTTRSGESHESPASMLGVMAALAAGCGAIGLAPGFVLEPLQQAVMSWTDRDRSSPLELSSIISTAWLSAMGVALVVLVLMGAACWKLALRANRAGTWDCGFAAPLPGAGAPRIQYTGSSFAQLLVGLFRWALMPKRHLPRVTGRFPGSSHFKSHVPDAVLDRGVLPLFRVAATFLPWVRLLQQGRSQIYVLYILVMLVILLLWR